jgi:hypothetical protein
MSQRPEPSEYQCVFESGESARSQGGFAWRSCAHADLPSGDQERGGACNVIETSAARNGPRTKRGGMRQRFSALRRVAAPCQHPNLDPVLDVWLPDARVGFPGHPQTPWLRDGGGGGSSCCGAKACVERLAYGRSPGAGAPRSTSCASGARGVAVRQRDRLVLPRPQSTNSIWRSTAGGASICAVLESSHRQGCWTTRKKRKRRHAPDHAPRAEIRQRVN